MQRPFIPILVIGSFTDMLSEEAAKQLTTMFRMLWRHPSLNICITNTYGMHLGKYIFYAAKHETMVSGRKYTELCTDVPPVLKTEQAYYSFLAEEAQTTPEQLQKEMAKQHREELIDYMTFSPNYAYKMVLIIGGGDTTMAEYQRCRRMWEKATIISLPEFGGTGEKIYDDILKNLHELRKREYEAMCREVNPKPLWEVISDLVI